MISFLLNRANSLRPSFDYQARAVDRHTNRRGLRFERLESRAMLSASGDFNGDGFDDLAIGAPSAQVGGYDYAGAVHVLYSTNVGLSATGDQYWTLNSSGVDGVANTYDNFGNALAAGDFDGDGFDDLAIGASGKGVAGGTNVGTVNILYGSSTGLRAIADQQWTQNSSGVNGVAHFGDGFGSALAAGDFDGDGRDDLVIGVIGDDLPGVPGAGAVNVLYGSANGLNASHDQLWSQATPSVNGAPATGETFGSSLATGDFNHDGRDDLAIGSFRDIVSGLEAGSVNIIYGSAGGLTAVGDQLWNQNTAGMTGTAEAGDRFGEALAVGDFNGDHFDDLAIGASGGNVGGHNNAGEVNVLYGSAQAIQPAGQQLITRDSLGETSVAEERFGTSLASGDFNGNQRDDLAIGAPYATLGGLIYVGYVQIVYGLANGLSASGQTFSQDTAGVLDTNEAGDNFGRALTTGDYNHNGRVDLAIGVPGQSVGGFSSAGQVAVFLGSATGIKSVNNQIWNAGSIGINGPFREGADFGRALV